MTNDASQLGVPCRPSGAAVACRAVQMVTGSNSDACDAALVSRQVDCALLQDYAERGSLQIDTATAVADCMQDQGSFTTEFNVDS